MALGSGLCGTYVGSNPEVEWRPQSCCDGTSARERTAAALPSLHWPPTYFREDELLLFKVFKRIGTSSSLRKFKHSRSPSDAFGRSG